jgi:hypothetical protein
METEDSGEEAASGTASAEKEAASTVGDVASSSSDVEAEKSAQQVRIRRTRHST